MKRVAIVAMVVVGMMVGIPFAQATQNIPYEESFNGWVVGGNWADDATGYVAGEPTVGLGGAGGAVVSNDTLTLNITPATYDNVWIHMYSKPVLAETEPTVTGVSGAWYVNTNDHLMALTDAGWQNLGAITTGGWIGFSAQVDYVNRKWNLYYTVNPIPGQNMTKANPALMNLATDLYSHAESVSVQSGDRAYLDEVTLAVGYEDAGDAQNSAAKIASGTIIIPAGVNAMVNCFGSFFDNNNNGLMNGTLGAALLDALGDGDIVRVWFDNGSGPDFQPYLVSATGGKHFVPLNGQGDYSVKPTDPLWISRSSGDGSVDVALFGSNPGVYTADDDDNVAIGAGEGFTPLSWPFNFAKSANFGFSDGTPNKAWYGDRLFVDTNGNGQYTWANYWGPGTWRTPSGLAVTISEGDGIWYFRYPGAGYTWVVTNVTP